MDAPAVAVTADGKTFATSWMDCQNQKGNRDVFWRISGQGSRPLTIDTLGIQGHTALADDDRGVFWVAWEDHRSGTSEIWTTHSGKGARGTLLSEKDKDGGSTFPALAAGGGGLAGVVYESDEAGVIFRVLRDEPKGSSRER